MTLLVVFPVVPSIECFFAESMEISDLMSSSNFQLFNHQWYTVCFFNIYRHEYGLSPVCSRWWIFSLNPKANPFPHSSQIWDFSRGTGCKWMYKAFARILVLTGWTTSFVYQDTKQPKNSLLANLFIAQWDFSEYCWDFSHLPFTFMTSFVSFPSIPSVKCFCAMFASVWSE